jgi:hypothetical protein
VSPGCRSCLFLWPTAVCRIDDAEVVETGIRRRGLTGFHKVRNRDGRQEADDGHDNHDFHQGKTRRGLVAYGFHGFAFVFCGGTKQRADLYDDDFVPELPAATATNSSSSRDAQINHTDNLGKDMTAWAKINRFKNKKKPGLLRASVFKRSKKTNH